MPNGQDVMSIGDKVIVVTTNQGLDDISAVSYTHLDVYKRQALGQGRNSRGKSDSN